METFFEINENMQNLYFKLAAILDILACSDLKFSFFFISEMELTILNIAGPLIKASITDGRRLILHCIGIMAAIMKPSKMADGTQVIEC